MSEDQIVRLLKKIGQQTQADLMLLQNVPETWNGRVHPLLLEGATPSPSPIFVRALPDDFDMLFRDTHSKSSRKNLQRKQTTSAGGRPGYRMSSRQRPKKRFEGDSELSLSNAPRRSVEPGIPNVFSSRPAQAFLEDLLGLGTAGEDPLNATWISGFLEAGGKMRCATYLCAQGGGTIHAYSNSVAHDDMLPNSPGLVLIKEIMSNAACADPSITELLISGSVKNATRRPGPNRYPLKDSRLGVSLKGNIKKNLEALRLQAKSAVRNSDVLWPLVRQTASLDVSCRRIVTPLRSD